MNCNEYKDKLFADVEGLLDDSDKEAIAAHLKVCPACRDEASGTEQLQGRLVADGAAYAESDLENAVFDRIVREQTFKLRKTERANYLIGLWRNIMNTKVTKFAAAAVIIIAVLGITFFDKFATPAWAIEQTTAAHANIKTIIVSGKSHHIVPLGNFNILLKRDADNWDSFLGRIESNDLVVVVDGDMRYDYILGCGEIYAKDVEDFRGFGNGVWNKIIKNAPWISPIGPTMLRTTKLLSTDWQETYGKYGNEEQTERDCVFVTGSYKPLSVSFWMIFDLESKLMVRAKYWTNLNRNGIPAVDIEKISYNEDIADEMFDPEKLAEAKVINKEEQAKRYALFNQAQHLAGKKQYRKAIEIFLQLYNEYPQSVQTPKALQFIGECYGILGQHEKAIEFFEKVLREYSAPKNAMADAYRLLGCSYMSIEQNNKALDNFEMCLEFIRQWDPEGIHYRESYRKQVEENIEEIKNKNR